MQVHRPELLVQREQLVHVQHAAEAPPDERVEPPEERTVVDAAGGLGRVRAVLLAQQPALAPGLQEQDEALDRDGCREYLGDDAIRSPAPAAPAPARAGAGGAEPQRPHVGGVEEEGGEEEDGEEGGWSDGADVLDVREPAEGQGGEQRQGGRSQRRPRSGGRWACPEDQRDQLQSTKAEPGRLWIRGKKRAGQ